MEIQKLYGLNIYQLIVLKLNSVLVCTQVHQQSVQSHGIVEKVQAVFNNVQHIFSIFWFQRSWKKFWITGFWEYLLSMRVIYACPLPEVTSTTHLFTYINLCCLWVACCWCYKQEVAMHASVVFVLGCRHCTLAVAMLCCAYCPECIYKWARSWRVCRNSGLPQGRWSEGR